MKFSKIDALSLELRNMRPLNDAEMQRLREEFIVENTFNSNAIEGNTLTLRETAFILQEGITVAGKKVREYLEVIGHKEAFEYIVELADSNTDLSDKVIKDIHSLVLMNDRENRGKFRTIPVQILGANHSPANPIFIEELLSKLISDYSAMKDNNHIIEAVSVFHLRFEGIHPFIDGNGRTGRLILNLELIKAGLLPINVKYTDRQRYYDCFDSFYSNKPDAEPLIELISEYEESELKKRIDMLK